MTKQNGTDAGILSKLNYIFDRRQRRGFFVLGILILIGGLFETLGVSMLVPVVEVVLDPNALHRMIARLLDRFPALSFVLQPLSGMEDRQLIVLLLVSVILLYAAKNAYLLYLSYRQSRFIAYSRNDMISRVMREFLNRPYEDYLAADIPTVFRITDSDIPHLFSMIMALLQLMTEIVVSTCLGLFLIYVNWRMTLLMLLVLACMTLLNTKLLKPRMNDVGARNQKIQSRIAKWRIQSIYGLKDVKVLNRQDFFIRNYYENGKTGAGVNTAYSVLSNLPRLLIETVFMASVLLFILFFILSGGNTGMLLTQLAAFGIAAIRLMPSANRINTYLAEIAYEEPSLNYVYENLTEGMKTEKRMAAILQEDAGEPLRLTEKIALRHITFRYPDTDRDIFTDAGMEVKKGASVGIMGASGAGKSTIVDILLGLLHVQEGEILCDGRSIFSNYASWLAQVGYIPQAIYLIDESIRDNIAFGIAAEEIDDERIMEVIREAQLYDFVISLPAGLDTKVGDRGVRLSGGQRQRIGIARALYHDPEILVFDEATSALDNETEAALMEAINAFHGKKTMVIIAHRLQTIAGCDVIYEVKDGKITETTL